jgi:hypothetical protein
MTRLRARGLDELSNTSSVCMIKRLGIKKALQYETERLDLLE